MISHSAWRDYVASPPLSEGYRHVPSQAACLFPNVTISLQKRRSWMWQHEMLASFRLLCSLHGRIPTLDIPLQHASKACLMTCETRTPRITPHHSKCFKDWTLRTARTCAGSRGRHFLGTRRMRRPRIRTRDVLFPLNERRHSTGYSWGRCHCRTAGDQTRRHNPWTSGMRPAHRSVDVCTACIRGPLSTHHVPSVPRRILRLVPACTKSDFGAE